MTNADKIRNSINSNETRTLSEIATDTGISSKACQVYLGYFLKNGTVSRSGDRGSYRYFRGPGGGAQETVETPALESGGGGDGGNGEVSNEGTNEPAG